MGIFKENWLQIRGHVKYDILKYLCVAAGGLVIAAIAYLLNLIKHLPTWGSPLGVLIVALAAFWWLGRALSRPQPITPPSEPMPEPASITKAVDLRGQFLELYLAKFDDLIGVTTTFMAVHMKIVNHGNDEVTITECGAHASLGKFYADGKVLSSIPALWRIKKKQEGISPAACLEYQIDPLLNTKDIYKKGIPIDGWLAFEFFLIGEGIEFPNAKFDVSFKDSLGNSHTITRPPGVYPTDGELIRIVVPPPPPPLPPNTSAP